MKKITSAKKPVKEKEIKETRAELFIRLAKPRVNNVIKALRILGNCSNKSRYEYTQEQVDSISNAIQFAFLEILDKFKPKQDDKEVFDF